VPGQAGTPAEQHQPERDKRPDDQAGVRRSEPVGDVDGGQDQEHRPEHEAQPAARGV
jgi:hypothetical protein